MTPEQLTRAFMQSDFVDALVTSKIAEAIRQTEQLLDQADDPFDKEDMDRWVNELEHLRYVYFYFTGSYEPL